MSNPSNTPHLFQPSPGRPALKQVGGSGVGPFQTPPPFAAHQTQPAAKGAGSTLPATGPDTNGAGSDETKATRAVPSPRAEQPAPARELLTVEAAAARLAIGRTTMFALLRSKAVESVKVGNLRRVPADAITAYITRLATEQNAA